MSGGLAALLALLFFAPLGFVYGRRVAAEIAAGSRAQGRSPLRVGLPKLVLPFALLSAMLWRLSAHGTSLEPGALAAGWRGLSGFLSLVDAVGGIAAILFFLTIPFALGRLFGVAAAALGLFADGDATATGLPESTVRGNRPWSEMRQSFRREGSAMPPRRFTVAIDGPAAAGKGTLAQRLAARYGLPYLDTGLLYRAVGRRTAELGLDLDDPDAAGAVARALTPSALDDGSLRGREAGELASRVAVHPAVRAALEAFQRDFARQPAGAILDGRDIGTVITPDAEVKIFVTASAEVRARRRTDELAGKGRAPDYERILAEVRERDRRDAGRATAPLKPASDAHLLDTSEMDIDAAFLAACGLVDAFLSRRRNGD